MMAPAGACKSGEVPAVEEAEAPVPPGATQDVV